MIENDNIAEGVEDLTVQLSSLSPLIIVNPPSMATVNIIDNDCEYDCMGTYTHNELSHEQTVTLKIVVIEDIRIIRIVQLHYIMRIYIPLTEMTALGLLMHTIRSNVCP